MSNQQRRVLENLKGNIRRNAPVIEKKISQSGSTPDPAIVYSAAKYYPALKRLAKE